MVEEIKTVSIIGLGIMGGFIARWLGKFNYSLRIYDAKPEVQAKARVQTRSINRKRKKFGNQLEVLNFDNLSDAVKDADLIIEAVPEILELKRKIFAEIDKVSPPHAIIATNSSSLPISKLEDSIERKDKILNLHFYAPIKARPMVDIMRGTKTSDDTFEKGKAWIESIECTPLIVKKESMGFVFNRIWHAVKRECLKIWAGGHADIETVDKAWKIFSGMAHGPFQMMDGVGLDTVWNIETAYYNESGDPNDEPPKKLKEKVDQGDLGSKTGKVSIPYNDYNKKYLQKPLYSFLFIL